MKGVELVNDKIPTILIVDDVEINVSMLKELVEMIGYHTITATSVNEAVERFEEEIPQMVLLDIVMPEVDGYQFCEILKENPVTRNIPVIFISAVNQKEDVRKAYEMGGVGFISKPFDYTEVELTINTHMKIYGLQEKLEKNNKMLNRVISEQTKRFEEEQRRLLGVIAKMAEEDTVVGAKAHQEMVARNGRILAQALNFSEKYENKISEKFVEGVEIAGAIHDIGKICISRDILTKPGPLTEEEKKIVETHTVEGYKMLKEIYNEFENQGYIEIAAEIIRWHHENWDGSGYPDGLKGNEIPLAAQIIRIVDSFDSLLRDHCYRQAFDRESVLKKMEERRGTYYNPDILDIFFKIQKQMEI